MTDMDYEDLSPYEQQVQDAQQNVLKRSVLAKALAARAGQQAAPGQMVGRVYVPTSPLVHLSNTIKDYQADAAQREALDAQQQLARASTGLQQAQGRQGQQWLREISAPYEQTTTTQPGMMDQVSARSDLAPTTVTKPLLGRALEAEQMRRLGNAPQHLQPEAQAEILKMALKPRQRYTPVGGKWAQDSETGQLIAMPMSEEEIEQKRLDRELKESLANRGNQTRITIAGMKPEPRAQQELFQRNVDGVPHTFKINMNTNELVDLGPVVPKGAGAAGGRGGSKGELDPAAAAARNQNILSNIEQFYDPRTGQISAGLRRGTGKIAVNVPNWMMPDETVDARANFESLKQQLTIDNMAEARKRAGQSFGSMTEREWPKFENQIRALHSSQSPESLAKNIGYIYNFIKRDPALAGALGMGGAAGGSGALSPAEQAELNALRKRFGK